MPLVAAAVLLTAGIWFSLRQPAPTVVQAPSRSAPKPNESFKDCDKCPEMVVVPAGSFTMGSPESERAPIAAAWANYGITPGSLTTNMPLSSEGPQHKVTIAQPLAVGRFAVTFDQWDACGDDGGCNAYHPSDQGWGRGTRPVVNVSWDEAKAYVGWLSRRTAKNYRLLSEAEREYMTRAATTTPFWWGSTFSTDQANYNGTRTYDNQPVGENRQKTLPVDFFAPNPWGFYQVSGNSYDWIEDCIHDDYFGAPVDGSAWSADNCKGHVVRGGAWSSAPWNLRSAFRGWFPTNFRSSNHGFRVARPLAP
jgi:formylglycine-generating enzyme required for sulfatase activity